MIKKTRKDIFVFQNTDNVIEMPRLTDVNLTPIDITSVVISASFTNSTTSETFYNIPVTKNIISNDGIYYLNFDVELSDLPPKTYIYNVNALINNSKVSIAFGNLIINFNSNQ